MTCGIHVGLRVVHPDHGAGVVESVLVDSRRGFPGGEGVDAFVRFDRGGPAVACNPDDLRPEPIGDVGGLKL